MTSRKTNYSRLAALAVTTVVVAACSSNNDDDRVPPGPSAPVNFAPTLAAVANTTVDQDTPAGPITLTVADQETAAGLLTVTAVADGTTVIPADGIVLGGTGASRTLTLTPLEAATGSANVTVTVTDPQGAVATRAFRVTVNARPASVRDTTLSTFALGESADATPLNGFTFAQDAEDPATFEPLIPAGDD